MVYTDIGIGDPERPQFQYWKQGVREYFSKFIIPYGRGHYAAIRVDELGDIGSNEKKYFGLVWTGSAYKWEPLEKAMKRENTPYRFIRKIWGRDDGVAVCLATGDSSYRY